LHYTISGYALMRDSCDAVGGVAGVDMGRMYRSTAGVLR
jgi:hypothetical protein